MWVMGQVVGLELWVVVWRLVGFSCLFDGGFGVLGSVVFFFSCCDWCLKEEVGMAKLGTGLIWMVVELALERKKIKAFFKLQQGIYWWVVVLGLDWWWVDEKERKTERWRTKMKREEREIFYIILLCNLYYLNIL